MVTIIRTFASFSVDDIDAAKRFYRDTLGMDVAAVSEQGPLFVRGPDGHETLIYPKPDHEPASFTVLNLSVANIEDAVDDLEAKGVEFERYEGIETDDRGIARSQDRAVAWFTDPASNVLAIGQES